MTTFLTRVTELAYRSLARTSPLRVWQYFDQRMNEQWLSLDELCALRWERLQRLLLHCYDNVPFYRDLWKEHGIDPRTFASEADVRRLPVVSKEMLASAVQAGNFNIGTGRGFQDMATSGTTAGSSFRVTINFRDYLKKYANHLRQHYVSGWRLGMRSAALHNSGHGHYRGKYDGKQERHEPWPLMRDLAFRAAHRKRVLVPYDDAQTGDIDLIHSWYVQLQQHRPFVWDTFFINALMLVDHIRRNALDPLQIPAVFILHTINDALRRQIKETLGGTTYNRYSPHECEGIGFSCEMGRGMHICIDTYHVEFLDHDGTSVSAGQPGRIVVTDLDNYSMPLIRYCIGDLGTWISEPCSCGRGLPLMDDIHGREVDAPFFSATSTVTPVQLERIVQGDVRIRMYQFIKDGQRLEARLVPADGLKIDSGTFSDIQDTLESLLGPTVNVEIRQASRLDFEPNGKFSPVKNLFNTSASRPRST